MSISSATIASNALGLVGESSVLTLLDETERARICNRHFDPLLHALLEEHPWNFATKRVNLVAVVTPEPVFTFSYTFQLPTDYLKVQEVFPDYMEYAIEGDKMLTTTSTAAIKYTRRITDLNKCSPLFILGFTYQLASLIAPKLKSDYKLSQMYASLAMQYLAKAKMSDAQAERSKEVPCDTLIDVRKVN